MKQMAITRAAEIESYNYLSEHYPEFLDAVETDVTAGFSPEQIKRQMIADTWRGEIAQRCYLAAKYVASRG